jgi:cytochrome P450
MTLQRLLLRGLQKYRPTLVLPHPFPGLTLVHRMALAREILERHEEFSVAHQGARMESCMGPSMLGMPEGPEYRRQLGWLKDVILRDDAAKIDSFLARAAAATLDSALRHKTSLNLASDYLDPLALAFIEHYFGIPDPGHGVLLKWYRMTSYYFFNVYLGNGPRIEVPALRAGKKLKGHLRAVVNARKSGSVTGGDDVLERMLRLQASGRWQISDDELAHMLFVVSTGSVAAPFGLVLNALDKLLSLPAAELDGAREAARHGQGDVVRDYVREAARFGPVPPVLTRYCEAGATIAQGTALECRIPRGSLVVIDTVAVNRDASVVAEPDTFRPGRPEGQRMLYGHALHHCLAASLGEAIMTRVAQALLERPVFRRSPGAAGQKQLGPKLDFPEGVYPMHLGVQLVEHEA